MLSMCKVRKLANVSTLASYAGDSTTNWSGLMKWKLKGSVENWLGEVLVRRTRKGTFH